MSQPLDGLGTFIGGLDFSFTRASTVPAFLVTFPEEWAMRQEDNVSTKGASFVQFDHSLVGLGWN
jgi:hypothetical protein